MEGRSRLLRLPLLLAALVVAWVLSRHWPTEHSVHIVLGDAAPRVREVRIRYGASADADAEREVSFHFAAGKAPRVVTHEPRLASGDYDVEVDVGVEQPKTGELRTVAVMRRVPIDTAVASVDVSSNVRDSLREAALSSPAPPP